MESTRDSRDTLYTLEITFHHAYHVPIGDINNLSSDPFLVALLSVPAHPNYGEDHPLTFRTPTARKTLHPQWEAVWRVAGIPSSGFKLRVKLYDEDPGSHDDRLGVVSITESSVDESFRKDNFEYPIKKRRGSVRAYSLTYIMSGLSKNISRHGRLFISMKVVEKTQNQRDRRVYTVGPHYWSVHYSPIIGRIVGTKGTDMTSEDQSNSSKMISTFAAMKLQLAGPVPSELRHRYVEYRPFIKSLFTGSGIRGHIFKYMLHRQYGTVYYYSRSTEYGVVGVADDAQEDTKEISLEEALATRFLEMCHWGEGARLYTYIITLDGEWRFSETGPEFTIDMLSKHSMHSDVAAEIAFSGEFFVQSMSADQDHDEEGREDERPRRKSGNLKSRNPQHYELIIDNSSGTYQPKKEYLPKLEEWLKSPGCLHSLGNVRAIDGFDDQLTKTKETRAEERKTLGRSSKRPEFVQLSSSMSGSDAERVLGRSGSLSSSDIEDVVAEARERERRAELEQEN